MYPFLPKLPVGVSDLHLSVAAAIRRLNNTSAENEIGFNASYERVKEEMKKLEGNEDDEDSIRKTLNYLGERFLGFRDDAAEFCSQRREDIKWQKQKAEWEERDRELEKQWQEEDDKFEEQMQNWDEELDSLEEKE